jgi:hypothetical protein
MAAARGLYRPGNFPNPDNNKPSADEALGQIFTDRSLAEASIPTSC